MKKVLLLIGASGVGKSTIAQKLCEEFPFYFIRSYTNRPPRTPEDREHIYCDDLDAYELLTHCDVVCSTIYGDYVYFALEHQFIDNRVNVYIVDELGLMQFYNYAGKHNDIITQTVHITRDVECERQSRDYTILPEKYKRVSVDNESVSDTVEWIQKLLEMRKWL